MLYSPSRDRATWFQISSGLAPEEHPSVIPVSFRSPCRAVPGCIKRELPRAMLMSARLLLRRGYTKSLTSDCALPLFNAIERGKKTDKMTFQEQ